MMATKRQQRMLHSTWSIAAAFFLKQVLNSQTDYFLHHNEENSYKACNFQGDGYCCTTENTAELKYTKKMKKETVMNGWRRTPDDIIWYEADESGAKRVRPALLRGSRAVSLG